MQLYLNEMTVLGVLLADPCLRYFPDGTAVLRITLETRSSQRDQYSNDIFTCSEHHDAVLYGVQAEQVAWSMRRGDSLWLRGPLQRRRFRDDLTGRSGTICEIEATQIRIISVKESRGPYMSVALAGWLAGHNVHYGATFNGLPSPDSMSGGSA